MKLTKRERVLLIGAFTIVAITVFFIYFYLPLQREIDSMKEKSVELNLDLQEAITKTTQIKQMEEERKEYENNLIANHSDILKIWDQAELLVFVEDTIDVYCSKESIDFFDPLKIGTISSGTVGIKIKTNYRDLLRLWKKLEDAKYFNSLNSFEIKKISDITNDIDGQAIDNSGENIVTTANNENDLKQLEVFMSFSFYSQDVSDKFPDIYQFVNGEYGKEDIFN